jgi:hypothetical protein
MRITALSINYNTPDFLERLLISFRQFYDIPFIVVDGSSEPNYKKIIPFIDKYDVEIHHFDHNIHHGPGLAYGIQYIKTEQILLLDSDLIVLHPGFVEDLQNKLKPDSYGIGDVQIIDSKGFNTNEGISYLHPACALINRKVALKYPLPTKHGAPMIEAMKVINPSLLQHEQWVTNDFRNKDKIFIIHDWQGTVKRTGGYHL